MADFVARVNKACGDVLEPGETVAGALNLLSKGQTAAMTYLGAVGGLAGMGLAERSHAKQDSAVGDDITWAELKLPVNGVVVAATNRRLLVFKQSFAGKPKELLYEWPIDDVGLDTIDGKTLALKSRLFLFGLPDGTVFAGELPANGKGGKAAEQFQAAFPSVHPN